jgi:hypothetical protein
MASARSFAHNHPFLRRLKAQESALWFHGLAAVAESRFLGSRHIGDPRRKDVHTEDAAAERTGVFTSRIVSTAQGQHIALFLTGRQHAAELAPPMDVLENYRAMLPQSGIDVDSG